MAYRRKKYLYLKKRNYNERTKRGIRQRKDHPQGTYDRNNGI